MVGGHKPPPTSKSFANHNSCPHLSACLAGFKFQACPVVARPPVATRKKREPSKVKHVKPRATALEGAEMIEPMPFNHRVNQQELTWLQAQHPWTACTKIVQVWAMNPTQVTVRV